MHWWTWFLVGLAAMAVVYVAFVAWLILLGRRQDARALATFVPDCISLVTRLARDPRVPRARKLLLLALIGDSGVPVRPRTRFHPRRRSA